MSKKRQKRALKNAIPFMLPSFLGMIVFSFLPIIISIAISFTNWNGLDKLSYKTLASNFVFLRYHGDLMFYKYTGVKSVIEIPAVVNGMYVKHIHPHAFTHGPFNPLHLFNKHKLFSTEHFSSSAGNMTQLILPKTIKYLPANFLYHVNAVELLVIPESVYQ